MLRSTTAAMGRVYVGLAFGWTLGRLATDLHHCSLHIKLLSSEPGQKSLGKHK